MGGISCSSVCVGCLTILFLEVHVNCLVVDYMPCRYQQLPDYGYDDLHLVFLPDLRLVIGEPAEEAVLCPACRPSTLDYVLSEIDVPVDYAA